MKNLRATIAAIILLPMSANSVMAYSFRCTLNEVKFLSEKGTFERHPLEKLLISQDIIIDRQTGKVFHSQFGNEFYSDRQVIDYGSANSSFKVVAYSPFNVPKEEGMTPFRNMTIVQVHTYVQGIDKPFVALNSGALGSGVCR